MEFNSNYSITRLFTSKEITIFDTTKTQKIKLILRPIRDFYEDDDWNIAYHILTTPDYKQLLLLNDNTELSRLDCIKLVLLQLGAYDQFKTIYTVLLEQLSIILPDFHIKTETQSLLVGDVILTDEIWDYVVYLLKLSYGEKVEKPRTFDSPEAKQFYLAQKAQEDKIARIRAKNGPKDEDGLMKIMLSITYAFPSITIDYLFDQTMAQIQWLQKYAAGSVSYEVNAKAFAAGNMKKGKKLDFFIK